MTRLVAAAGVVAISFSAVFVRLAGVSPVTAAFFRAAYAIPLLALVWMSTRGKDERDGRVRGLAVLSGAALACDLGLWHESIVLIGVGLATVLANVLVVILPLAGWAIDKERPSRSTILVAAIVIVGMVCASGLSRGDAYGTNPALGVVLGGLAGVCYSVYLLLFRVATRRSTPRAQGSDTRLTPFTAGSLLDATIGLAAGSLLLSPLDAHFSWAITWPAHGWLLALAVVSQVIGWLAITSALPLLPAVQTSILLMLQPVFSVIWGFVLFGERLSPLQWTGAALVLLGVAATPRK
jgi:drug/metabolite transporter (DMT)-like permease